MIISGGSAGLAAIFYIDKKLCDLCAEYRHVEKHQLQDAKLKIGTVFISPDKVDDGFKHLEFEEDDGESPDKVSEHDAGRGEESPEPNCGRETEHSHHHAQVDIRQSYTSAMTTYTKVNAGRPSRGDRRQSLLSEHSHECHDDHEDQVDIKDVEK